MHVMGFAVCIASLLVCGVLLAIPAATLTIASASSPLAVVSLLPETRTFARKGARLALGTMSHAAHVARRAISGVKLVVAMATFRLASVNFMEEALSAHARGHAAHDPDPEEEAAVVTTAPCPAHQRSRQLAPLRRAAPPTRSRPRPRPFRRTRRTAPNCKARAGTGREPSLTLAAALKWRRRARAAVQKTAERGQPDLRLQSPRS